MKKALLAAIAVLLLASVAFGAKWDISRATQNGDRLTIHVTETPQKAHNYKITNVRGEEVGTLFGFKGDMLVFEGSWDAIVRQQFAGLYLDGDGHREPLFKPVSGAIWKGGQAQYVYRSDLDEKTKRYVIHEPNTPGWNSRVKKEGVTVIPRQLIHTFSDGVPTVVQRRNDVVRLQDGTTTIIERDNHTIVLRNGTPTTITRPDGTKVMGPGQTIILDASSVPGPVASVGEGEGCESGEGENASAGGEGIGPAPGPGDTAKADAECKVCKGTKKCPKCDGKAEGCKSCTGGECPACGCGSPGEALALGPGDGPGPPPGEAPCEGKSPGEAPAAAPGPGGPGSGPGPGGPGKPQNKPNKPGMAQNGTGPTGPQGPGAIGAQPPGNEEKKPAFVMYVACGDNDSGEPGKVYQVNEHGRILGWINVPSAPTGIALHRDNGVVVTLPRNGGQVVRIGDNGKWNVLLEKQKGMVHPVDVGIAGGSDSILVADNISDVLMATTVGGTVPKVYERFEGQKWTAQSMSVAITSDKHGIWGDDTGIFRDNKRILPGVGGVAANPANLQWAATQTPNQLYVLEGEELQRKLRLPPGKSLYNQGMLSFGPSGSLAVAARDSDQAASQPWFLLYDDDAEEIRTLFQWEKEKVNDFVIGPRMLWDNAKEGVKPKGIY